VLEYPSYVNVLVRVVSQHHVGGSATSLSDQPYIRAVSHVLERSVTCLGGQPSVRVISHVFVQSDRQTTIP
jgi:hypothetical protein